MNGVQNEAELRALFNCVEFESLLLETGYSKPLAQLTIDDQKSIVSSITDYHCLTKVKAAMDQFIEGLDVGGVLGCIKTNPHQLKPMFCPGENYLTAGNCYLPVEREVHYIYIT